MNQNQTPILAAVRAMHAAEDAGRDPYNTVRARPSCVSTISEQQRREAEANLACFDTELTLVQS